ncbi:MAG: HAD family phosphatase [Moritella sp.]|uniref:HAD family hydrolase n=1 Tax=Moritella sp. TaxID=78556 RepID=UPI0029B354BC|nr:HAD family phosphatase [Moritella sp.]MDX2319672.1 HAD family phosphatase [Moritella sp.]
MNYQAAIFDMDGLLLDTERVCKGVFEEACASLSIPFLEDVYLDIIGRNAQGIEKVIRAGYGRDLDYPVLHNAWKTRYNAVVKHQAIPVKDGVVELLTWLKNHNIPTAVATSTQQDIAKIKLSLAGLDHYFDNLTTGCEVKNGKPDPEIYLLAAERLNIQPQQCLAFEDSNNGVRSAVSANMQTFQIPDLVQPSTQIRTLGHTISASLSDVLAVLKQRRQSA